MAELEYATKCIECGRRRQLKTCLSCDGTVCRGCRTLHFQSRHEADEDERQERILREVMEDSDLLANQWPS